MKNQYFGDVRDLFKYDLVYWLFMNLQFIDHFAFIPMLTEPDNRDDGQKTDYLKAKAGNKNKGLVLFLGECIDDGKRDMQEIQKHFRTCGIRISIYKAQEYFTQKNRQEYFKGVGNNLLRRSLVFLDPDNGMEVKNSNKRHVLYAEIEDIYERMDKDSILMIYQHFPRINHAEYLDKRSTSLYELTGALPLYIHDNEVIFYLLTKEIRHRDSIKNALMKYQGEYRNLEAGNLKTGARGNGCNVE